MTSLAPHAPTGAFTARLDLRQRRARLSHFARQHPGTVLGFLILLAFVLIAVLAPALAPYDPIKIIRGAVKQEPSLTYPFGTDNLGRDVLSRVIFGTRVSITVGLIAVAIALLIGTTAGTIAAYYGGRIDALIMGIIDIMLAFPGILLAIAIVATLGPSLNNTMIAVGISTVPVYARTARGTVLSVKANEYVEAARCIGLLNYRIILRHVLPNIVAPIIVLTTVNIGTAILSAAGLSYLGLGAQPPTAEWGAMLAEARSYLRDAWWMATFPGLAIMLIVLAVNLLGDGLRDALDPRLRNRS